MILKTLYTKDYEEVYVYVYSPKRRLSWFLIFDYDEFYKRYHPNHQEYLNLPLLKGDIIDTFLNNVGSVPYTKEELFDELIIDVESDLIKRVKL